MRHIITQLDISSLCQESIDYRYRLYIVNSSGSRIDLLEGIRSVGEYHIDAESDIRRTSSFVLQLDEFYRKKSLEQKIYSWLGYDFLLQIGVYNIRQEDYIWYDCGYYTITDTNTHYSAVTNELQVSLSDRMARLDGTRNGVIGGASVIKLPMMDENGRPITINQSLSAFIQLSSDLSSGCIIDDIGEFYGLPENNPDWEQYRIDRPHWNALPYDLEFDGNASIYDVVKELCTLYPGYQYYFDVYGNFCVSMIPSCDQYPITIDNTFLQEILVADDSETVNYDMTGIKNVTEVFGRTYEIDRMSHICTASSNIYTITLDSFDSYKSGEYIAFVPDTCNIADMKLRINDLEVLPIYLEDTTTYIDAGIMNSGEVYVVRVKLTAGSFVAYYLGQYQPHALCVLTDSETDSRYTKEYFAAKYNCDVRNVVLRVEDSPFSVQKIGEVLDYKSGSDFEYIESDMTAMENAIYYNRQSTTFQDVVTIKTKMIPFLDVYEKVSYRRKQEYDTNDYIIRSVSHNLDEMTSTITMYRFHPLYYL